MKVLVVDRDNGSVEILRQSLPAKDLDIQHVVSGLDAIRVASLYLPDLILLEVDLEGPVSGIEVCSTIRERVSGSVSIVFYTSKMEEFIQVIAYDSGADDFIIKYKKPYYLRSKISSILRRGISSQSQDNRIILDSESRVIIKGGKPIYLSRREFDLFQLLHSHPNKVLNRSHILKVLWNITEERSRMLDVHVCNLRDKLGDDIIKTIKGIGYSYTGNN